MARKSGILPPPGSGEVVEALTALGKQVALPCGGYGPAGYNESGLNKLDAVVLDHVRENAPLWSGSVPTLSFELSKVRRAILEQRQRMSLMIKAAWIKQSVCPAGVVMQGFRPSLRGLVVACK